MFRELIDGEYLVLDDWLERATNGLCAEAADRVREEIESHYAESVASLIENGARPGAAELEAIKQLGSPYKARRGFFRKDRRTNRRSYGFAEHSFTSREAPIGRAST